MNEGKIISADELKRKVVEQFEQTRSVNAFLKMIDDEPAITDIEPVKEGVWLYTEAEGGLKYWLCSNCRDSYHKKNPHDMRRCYRCGAYMRMEGHR